VRRGLRHDVAVHVFLETDRMLLRRFTDDDVDLLVELDNDPAVMQFINGGLPVPREEIVDETLPAFLSYYERFEGYGFWAAIDKASGRFLGWFHFRPNVGDGDGLLEPELGYRLHREAWGRGFASEGSRALIDMGFERLGVERVHASTMAVNVGSWRVMEKAGMRFVRTFHADWPVRIAGDEQGDVEYEIDRAQWEAVRAAPS
jgi:RimJ/RimL family protein N-acetyltransferase